MFKELKKIVTDNWSHWLRTLTTFIVIFTIISLFGLLPRIGFLRYYIDGFSINRYAIGSSTSSILWEKPIAVKGSINSISNNDGLTTSEDGKIIIFSHKYAPDNYDLYISKRHNGSWDIPTRLSVVNSEFNEKDPFLSADQKYLFFSSDRDGGKGLYDIWCSISQKNGWSEPFHIGGSINTNSDDRHPSLTADGAFLYFSSNRKHDHKIPLKERTEEELKHDFNIYQSTKIVLDEKQLIPQEGPPAFNSVTYLENLNTPYYEGKISVSPRGDLFYFCSDRPGGFGGIDLYRTHYVNNDFMKPVNFGLPVNTAYDEFSPNMLLEGFKVVFSSNKFSRSKADNRFYETTYRQVISRIDYSVFIALFLVIAGVVLIYYLTRLLFSNVDMKTVTRCLLASLLVHLMMLVLSSGWFLGGKLGESLLEGPEEMTINVNNLARENIAVAIKEGIASLPKVPSEVPMTRPMDVPSPNQKQQPVSKVTEAVSVKPSKVYPSMTPATVAEMANEPDNAPFNKKALTSIKPSFLGESNIRMEVPQGKSEKASGTAKGKNKGLPKPQKPTPPTKRIRLDVAKLPVRPMDIENTEITFSDEAINQSIVKSSKATIPGIAAVNPDNKLGKTTDTLSNISEKPSLAAGTRSMLRDSGMMRFPESMRMETVKKTPESTISYKLGMLSNDKRFAQLMQLETEIPEDQILTKELLKNLIILHNLMKFNSFSPMQFILPKGNGLDRIGNMLYEKSPRLYLPADTELEVPENYNQ